MNLSKACESGLKAELERIRNERWLEENREAIDSWNDWVRENGLPLEEFRQF